jgi:hypothetical protein
LDPGPHRGVCPTWDADVPVPDPARCDCSDTCTCRSAPHTTAELLDALFPEEETDDRRG